MTHAWHNLMVAAIRGVFSLPRRPRAFWISACNLLGLLCSVAGVVLLFWFALPEPPPGGPGFLTGGGGGPKWEAEVQRYNWNAHLGLALVLLGTLLEGVPPFCTGLGSWRRRPIARAPVAPSAHREE
jgi:hypothetical protein